MRSSCRDLFDVAVRWTMISCIGMFFGLLLESIHNGLLCQLDLDVTPMSPLSRWIMTTFRAKYRLRLTAGWASSLSSLFAILNLSAGTALCALAARAQKQRTSHRACVSILDYCLLCNLVLFSILLPMLLIPAIPISGIMGVAEHEVVPGASPTGNLLCEIEKVLYVALPIVFVFAIIMPYLRAKKGAPCSAPTP